MNFKSEVCLYYNNNNIEFVVTKLYSQFAEKNQEPPQIPSKMRYLVHFPLTF